MGSQAAATLGRNHWIAVAVAVVAVAVIAWWRGCAAAGKEDPRVAEIRVMHEEMAARFPPGQAIRSPDEAEARVAAMQVIFDKVQSLPPELRGPALLSGGRSFRASIDAKIDEFFSLPPARRAAFLDLEIDQMEMMRTAFGAVSGPPGRGSGPGPRPPFPPANLSESDAQAMRKHMVDGTTPERRARMEEFFGAMQQRRRQRGLPTLPEPP